MSSQSCAKADDVDTNLSSSRATEAEKKHSSKKGKRKKQKKRKIPVTCGKFDARLNTLSKSQKSAGKCKSDVNKNKTATEFKPISETDLKRQKQRSVSVSMVNNRKRLYRDMADSNHSTSDLCVSSQISVKIQVPKMLKCKKKQFEMSADECSVNFGSQMNSSNDLCHPDCKNLRKPPRSLANDSSLCFTSLSCSAGQQNKSFAEFPEFVVSKSDKNTTSFEKKSAKKYSHSKTFVSETTTAAASKETMAKEQCDSGLTFVGKAESLISRVLSETRVPQLRKHASNPPVKISNTKPPICSESHHQQSEENIQRVSIWRQNLTSSNGLASKYLSGHKCSWSRMSGLVPECCFKAEVGGWKHIEDSGPKSLKCRAAAKLREEVKEAHVFSKASSSQLVEQRNTFSERDNILELPGFYYDHEKCKYFAILPGYNGQNSGAVTRATVTLKHREEKRCQDIKSLLCPFPKTDRPLQSSAILSQRRLKHPSNVLTCLELMRFGIIDVGRARHEISSAMMSNLHPIPVVSRSRCLGIVDQLIHDSSANQIIQFRRIGGIRYNSVISVSSISKELDQQHACMFENSNGEIETVVNYNGITTSQPFVSQNQHDSLSISGMHCMCLMTIVNAADRYYKVPLLVVCDVINNENDGWLLTSGRSIYVYRYKGYNDHAIAQCCAFNSCDGQEFAIGTDRGINIGRFPYDVAVVPVHAELAKLNTNKASVLSLCYAHTTPNILFAGTRNKRIYLYDRKSSYRNGQSPCACMETAGGVTNLYLTRNEYHLVSADFSGNISMYDLRKGAVVKEFKGHVNDYAVTSFGVDKTEDFLYAVGSDCQTRLWDFKTGNLLRTLPPPVPPSRENIPKVCFSQHMGGPTTHSRPGLIMGIQDNFYFYTI